MRFNLEIHHRREWKYQNTAFTMLHSLNYRKTHRLTEIHPHFSICPIHNKSHPFMPKCIWTRLNLGLSLVRNINTLHLFTLYLLMYESGFSYIILFEHYNCFMEKADRHSIHILKMRLWEFERFTKDFRISNWQSLNDDSKFLTFNSTGLSCPISWLLGSDIPCSCKILISLNYGDVPRLQVWMLVQGSNELELSGLIRTVLP